MLAKVAVPKAIRWYVNLSGMKEEDYALKRASYKGVGRYL